MNVIFRIIDSINVIFTQVGGFGSNVLKITRQLHIFTYSQGCDRKVKPFFLTLNKPFSSVKLQMGKRKNKRAEKDAEEQLEEKTWDDNTEPETKLELVNGDSDDQNKKKKKKKKRDREKNDVVVEERPTVSIAVPGSIIDNAQSLELATRVIISISHWPPLLC